MANKQKRKLKPWVKYAVIAVCIAALALIVSSAVKAIPANTDETAGKPKPQETEQQEETAETEELDPSVFTDTDSLLVVANKKHPLPPGYVPSDLSEPEVPKQYDSAPMRYEAAVALENMFAAAANDGVTLILGSAYRSEDYQATLYNGYVEQYGQAEADTISSRPGYSDHQTGLAADISDHDGATYLTQDMEYTPEGEWLKDHAHEYGFIMRYPKGKEDITGYAYEPWHFRYIGVDYATAIYNVDEFYSFEEYFGVEGGDYE